MQRFQPHGLDATLLEGFCRTAHALLGGTYGQDACGFVYVWLRNSDDIVALGTCCRSTAVWLTPHWQVPWVLEICWRQVTCPVGLFSATLHVGNHLLRLLHVESSKSQFGHSRSTIAGPYSQPPQRRAQSDLPFPCRYAGCLHGHLRVGSQATWAGPTTRCHHSSGC